MAFAEQLARTRTASRFADRALSAQPDLMAELDCASGQPFARENMLAGLEGINDADALAGALRRLRLAVMLRTIHRDINGLATLDEVVRTVSDLADVAVTSALDWHARRLAAKHGTPVGTAGPMPLWVVGMGKLGGLELNVSSDIDLVFVYAEDGETSGDEEGRHRISHHEFFARLGKAVIAALDEVTHEGRVFRVDMRLRPFGDSGPLVVSLDSLEHYFITSARPWERYAWLKARVLGGADAKPLDDLVRPFVYRKYHDYGMIQDLRDLHANIRSEANRKNRLDDIKVGAGGIREVEFIAQLQQLIRGGRESVLQTRSTRKALHQMRELGLMEPDQVSKLETAYAFLRNLEHRLQYLDDAQTQALPTDAGDRARIAAAMNFPDWNGCLAGLDTHRAMVSECFNSLFAAGRAPASQAEASVQATIPSTIWQDSAEIGDEAVRRLLEAGFIEAAAAEIVRRLAVWRESARFRFLTEKARGKLERLIPRALSVAAAESDPHATSLRLLDVLEAVDRRDAYLSLLIENPGVLQRAARLAGKSAWAAGLLQRHPILLDELVKNRRADACADWAAERAWLSRELLAAGADTERHFELLRHFKQIHTLRLNIADVDGTLDVMTLADELSALADLLLDMALALAWRAMGKSASTANTLEVPPAFGIVGYGKLGSKELGYASDLDLVFIRDERREAELDGQTAHRLAQRVNQLLTALTTAGALYETDLRLRPDGDAGMLVPTLESFRDYQLNRAWTWEHQALTRARYCAGDTALAQRFDAIRGAILGVPRNASQLRDEVLAMRAKMRAEHPGTPEADGRCDLKHAEGGIVDLEFIVQFLVLRHANRHASITRNVGNFNLLALCGELRLIEAQPAQAAAEAYLAFRARQHLARNNNESRTMIGQTELLTERDAVQQLWSAVFGQ